jgi:TPR repeat protein
MNLAASSRALLVAGLCTICALLQAAAVPTATELAACRKRAEAGDARSQSQLGVYYEKGLGVPVDLEVAFKWHLQAAKQGDLLGQRTVADMYLSGRGPKKDVAEATRWWLKSAEQGDLVSQYNLALSYYHGTGVTKDLTKFIYWNRRAAMQGEFHAQCDLAEGYEYGMGTTKDLVEAYAWYSVSATKDPKLAGPGLLRIGGQLKPEELAQARKRAMALLQEIKATPLEQPAPSK